MDGVEPVCILRVRVVGDRVREEKLYHELTQGWRCAVSVIEFMFVRRRRALLIRIAI